jgi:hypothetical protein
MGTFEQLYVISYLLFSSLQAYVVAALTFFNNCRLHGESRLGLRLFELFGRSGVDEHKTEGRCAD